jgi:GNAT superfamily N-acetyltransferase
MPDSIRRFASYLKRHGVRATAGRIALSWQRFRAGNWFVIYSCNLQEVGPLDDASLQGGRVERRDAQAEIPPDDLSLLISNWAPAIARRQMAGRFERAASLWEFKIGERLAGYGWSIAGGTMEPYFFPLEPGDVHLFDFFVFPEFRGRRINPMLVNYILSQLKLEKKNRAFIESAEWNVSQLSSLSRTAFRLVGKASIRRRPGKTLVIWSSTE